MRRTNQVLAGVMCAAMLAVSGCGGDSDDSGSDDSSAGGTVKLGYLTSLSGAASAGFTGVEDGAKARLEAYKADGGKCASTTFDMVMGDDASSPQGALTATQKLVQQDKVFAVLPASSFFFGAGQFAGTTASTTPFMGASFDGGPQWLNEDYKNLFTATGSVDFPKVADTYGKYWTSLGATKAAAVSFDTASSSSAALSVLQSAEEAGIPTGYSNVKVPFGSTDVGPIVLGIQQSGADVLYLPTTPDTAFAIIGGLKQAGVELKSVLLATGYGADLLKSEPAVQAGQGAGFLTVSAPTELGGEAETYQSDSLIKYADATSPIPSFSQQMGWLTTDLFLHGFELADCKASQADVISQLRGSSDWDANGLFGGPTDFSSYGDIAGGNGPGNCIYVSILEGSKFTPDPAAAPLCGELTGQVD